MNQIIFAASLSSLFFGLFGVSWQKVDRKISAEFPSVNYISTDQLASEGQNFILFDVREAEEFAVSHIPGAANIQQSSKIAARVADKSTAIVVYCSVGYRSAAVADELQQLGYSNVLNLHHSIFEWVEKGHPLINNKGSIDKVHPFSRAWGSLIDEAYHQLPK